MQTKQAEKTTHGSLVQILRIKISLKRHIGTDSLTCGHWVHRPVHADHLIVQGGLFSQRMTTSLGEQRLKRRHVSYTATVIDIKIILTIGTAGTFFAANRASNLTRIAFN